MRGRSVERVDLQDGRVTMRLVLDQPYVLAAPERLSQEEALALLTRWAVALERCGAVNRFGDTREIVAAIFAERVLNVVGD